MGPVSSQAKPRHGIDVKLAPLEIGAVDVGDLELAARRRLQARRDLDDLVS